jgi:hypothetical protein
MRRTPASPLPAARAAPPHHPIPPAPHPAQRHISDAHDYSQLERAHTHFLARLLNQSLLGMHSVRGSMGALLGSVIDLCRLAEDVAGECPPGLRQVQDVRARFEAAVGAARTRLGRRSCEGACLGWVHGAARRLQAAGMLLVLLRAAHPTHPHTTHPLPRRWESSRRA